MKKLECALIAGALFFAVSFSTASFSATWNVVAEATVSESRPEVAIAVGDIITLQFTYNDASPLVPIGQTFPFSAFNISANDWFASATQGFFHSDPNAYNPFAWQAGNKFGNNFGNLISNQFEGFSILVAGVAVFPGVPGIGTPATVPSLVGATLAEINLHFTDSSGDLLFNIKNDLTRLEISAANIETPLPAALPLFATILAGGGLIAWRRKRKAAAVA